MALCEQGMQKRVKNSKGLGTFIAPNPHDCESGRAAKIALSHYQK